MKKKALAVAVSVLFATMLLVAPQASADVYVPPGPPYDYSEWIIQGLHVIDLQTMEPIGWKYTDGPTWDPVRKEPGPWIDPWYPEIEGPTWIPFSTWVMVFGCIPGVVVSPDQVPPPVVLVITWNGIPYAVTLDISGGEEAHVVGMEYPPVKYGEPCPHVPEEFRDELPCFETVYPWVYPVECEGSEEWKKAYYNVWVGDWDCSEGPMPHGYYFWYIFHPNVGDWLSIDCVGWTKHPPTYDITALFEYSTSQIWFNHKCFDVRLLEVHKEIEPDHIPKTVPSEPWTVERQPIEDAWVKDIEPDTNFGEMLHARSDIYEVRRSYLKFDVSGLDIDCLVRARLYMYCEFADYPVSPAEIDVEITKTTDYWAEDTITWTSALADAPPGPLVDTIPVGGPGFYYVWEGTLIDYVIEEATADGILSLAAKLPDDFPGVNPAEPFFHRDFDSREMTYQPYLLLEFVCLGEIAGAPEVSNILTITNVGKVPAHDIDIWESFPTEPKAAVIPKWDTCTAKIFGGRHIFATPLGIREWFLDGNDWPFVLPPPFDVLYPGETMVISMEASVNVPSDWDGCFVIEAMVSACEIPPWKYPHGFDILVVGEPEWGSEVLWEGWVLCPNQGVFNYVELVAPCPCHRNPIPQKSIHDFAPYYLDPEPVDLTGDGVINTGDVAQVELAILGLEPFKLEMDVNANGKVDTYDLACYEQAAAA